MIVAEAKIIRTWLPLLLVLLAGCRQRMADQPSYKPLDACDFFPDGRSARLLVPGTVPRGYLRTDTALLTGRRTAKGAEQDLVTGFTRADLRAQIQPQQPQAAIDEKALYAQFVDVFPFPITERIVEHGYQRYMIYCVVCHDPLGTGHGKIVERGYTPPPSYHNDRLRRAPPGYLFAVISEGYGSMPSYAAQIPPRDRWAIVAYLRALQASQHSPVAAAARSPQEPRALGGMPSRREASGGHVLYVQAAQGSEKAP
jgi:mono/diheme cytochrome c family protein